MAKRKMTTDAPVTEEVKEVVEPIKVEKAVTVKCPKLNFRNEPNTDSEIISVLVEGDQVKVLEDGADWTKVKVGRKTGYVMTQYIG